MRPARCSLCAVRCVLFVVWWLLRVVCCCLLSVVARGLSFDVVVVSTVVVCRLVITVVRLSLSFAVACC